MSVAGSPISSCHVWGGDVAADEFPVGRRDDIKDLHDLIRCVTRLVSVEKRAIR